MGHAAGSVDTPHAPRAKFLLYGFERKHEKTCFKHEQNTASLGLNVKQHQAIFVFEQRSGMKEKHEKTFRLRMNVRQL